MKKTSIFLFTITLFTFCKAAIIQSDTAKKIYELHEIKVYSTNKSKENIKDVSYKIDIIVINYERG